MAVDIYFDALDQCRTTARKVAGDFTELGAAHPAASADSTMFGRLTDASTLAQAIDDVEKTLDSELGAVATKLRGVERALDDVEGNLRGVNRATEQTYAGSRS
ncbi:hypothetical protein Misp01_01320 [Microtetraspora sp. NBRC 13810]|uniref:hypothetical protein n=1 Tax=Microtetraspora sp. NBRC 13810 TaxID=3030990 RepID=UPI0024A25E68|nr:hypothetical protein [Microtetraspora sp. NBRC 13810]GLW05002.1 hypothetical protein Misp01_01320 [Microtetraspora sp. NBRC 13810]